MMCNSEWPEILNCLCLGQTAFDISTIVGRAFKHRLYWLQDLLRTKFGQCVYMITIIEFQKRWLPHAHIVIKVSHPWLVANKKTISIYFSTILQFPLKKSTRSSKLNFLETMSSYAGRSRNTWHIVHNISTTNTADATVMRNVSMVFPSQSWMRHGSMLKVAYTISNIWKKTVGLHPIILSLWMNLTAISFLTSSSQSLSSCTSTNTPSRDLITLSFTYMKLHPVATKNQQLTRSMTTQIKDIYQQWKPAGEFLDITLPKNDYRWHL